MADVASRVETWNIYGHTRTAPDMTPCPDMIFVSPLATTTASPPSRTAGPASPQRQLSYVRHAPASEIRAQFPPQISEHRPASARCKGEYICMGLTAAGVTLRLVLYDHITSWATASCPRQSCCSAWSSVFIVSRTTAAVAVAGGNAWQ